MLKNGLIESWPSAGMYNPRDLSSTMSLLASPAGTSRVPAVTCRVSSGGIWVAPIQSGSPNLRPALVGRIPFRND
jgi:hypothetical protein